MNTIMSSFLLIEKMKLVNKKIANWTPIKSIYYSCWCKYWWWGTLITQRLRSRQRLSFSFSCNWRVSFNYISLMRQDNFFPYSIVKSNVSFSTFLNHKGPLLFFWLFLFRVNRLLLYGIFFCFAGFFLHSFTHLLYIFACKNISRG